MATAAPAAPADGAEAPHAFEQTMAAHESALLRYATRLLNDPHAAQDVVQETFVKLHRYWRDGAQPMAQLASWLYRVTHNAAVDYIRREDRLRALHTRQAEDPPDPPADDPPARALERAEMLTLALAQVRRLDPGEQQVVILRLQEGMSYQRISEITGRTEGNVGCILHHAVKKIAAGLKRAGAV